MMVLPVEVEEKSTMNDSQKDSQSLNNSGKKAKDKIASKLEAMRKK